MYIKIVKQNVGEISHREHTYECNNFNIVSNEDGKTLILNPGGGIEPRWEIDIDEASDQIYIMNGEGKTIDYYQWACGNPVEDTTQEQN